MRDLAKAAKSHEKGLINVAQALVEGKRLLAEQGVEDPRAEASLLLAFALGKPREYVYVRPEVSLTAEQSDQYREVLEQRARRVPYAYIVGNREFMGLDFFVNETVLIPRPETETLVEAVLGQGARDNGQWTMDNGQGTMDNGQWTMDNGQGTMGRALSLLDLCTGSGAVALALAVLWPEWSYVVGTDVSVEALDVARCNAERLGLSSVVWRRGDLWEAVGDERFDCITANPPYIATEEYDSCAPEVRCEPRLALWGGVDGLDFYRRIVAGAAAHLQPGGRLFLEIGWKQAASVCGLLAGAGFAAEVIRDLAGRDRVVAAWRGG